MKEDKYIFRIMGPIIGFMISMFSLSSLEKLEPEVWYKNKDLENKIYYLNQSSNYLKKTNSNYLISFVGLKRDSLIKEKNELGNTLECGAWEEGESKRKGKTGGIFGFGLLAGFAGGYYLDKKRLKKK